MTVFSMMTQLTNLKTLALKRTHVRSLPISLPEIIHLKKLELDVERMVFPPPEICKAMGEGILGWRWGGRGRRGRSSGSRNRSRTRGRSGSGSGWKGGGENAHLEI